MDTGTTEEYERWFARWRPMPLTDPNIPVLRRQEDFPLVGEEEGDDEDEEDEGRDEDDGDDDDRDEDDEDDEDGDEDGDDEDEPDSGE